MTHLQLGWTDLERDEATDQRPARAEPTAILSVDGLARNWATGRARLGRDPRSRIRLASIFIRLVLTVIAHAHGSAHAHGLHSAAATAPLTRRLPRSFSQLLADVRMERSLHR